MFPREYLMFNGEGEGEGEGEGGGAIGGVDVKYIISTDIIY